MTTDDLVISRDADEAIGAPLSPKKQDQARVAVSRHGFVQIDGALTREYIETLRTLTLEHVQSRDEGALERKQVGAQRYMTAVPLEGAFFNPDLYANARVLPVVNDLLGGQATIAGVLCVAAAPGAPAQHRHIDHPPLFRETAISTILPCHAVTVVVPLVDVGRRSGATAVWLGSHRDMVTEPTSRRDEDAYVPEAAAGSVYLLDYRLAHYGLENPTNYVRPILTLIYARPWFVDSVNHRRVARVLLSEDLRAQIPEPWRPLFTHALSR